MDKASYLYGGISEKKRNALLQFWLEDKACRIMVAIPAAAKFGHTWLKANLSIYFSGTEDFEDHAQSRDRNYRRGQTRSVTECKLITTNTVEKVIWKAIANKGRLDDFMKRYALERAKSSKIT
jgi:SNF2 family DNA or RNA helicase